MNNTITCFTDASYSQHKRLSVIGYKIGDNDVMLEELPYIKNTQAEMYAVIKCIRVCRELYPNSDIELFTDCQKAVRADNYPDYVSVKKIKGHKKKALKDANDKIFSTVDKAVRKHMRNSEIIIDQEADI